MAGERTKPGAQRKLITTLTFTGGTRIGRAFAEAHAAVIKQQGQQSPSNNTGAFQRARSDEYIRRLRLAGVPVEVQTRKPKSQLPPPVQQSPRKLAARGGTGIGSDFGQQVAKAKRKIVGDEQAYWNPPPSNPRTPGWLLVRVPRRDAHGRPRDNAAAYAALRESWTGQARYISSDARWFIFERPPETVRAPDGDVLAGIAKFRRKKGAA